MLQKLLLLSVGIAFILIDAAHAALDADAIGKVVGVKASASPDGVVRVTFPRNEVNVTVDGIAMKPFAGLSA